MKKIAKLILFGLIILNSTIFSSDQKEIPIKNLQQTQLNKSDLIKLSAALLGCSFFTLSFIMTPQVKSQLMELKPHDCIWYKPTLMVGLPVGLIFAGIFNVDIVKSKKANDLWAVSTSLISLASAYKCGSYIHRKVSSIKKNKADKARYLALN